jgi:hypothetical protein
MNERIKGLAEHAYEYSDIPNTDGVFNKEKFAELIVLECIKVMVKNDYHGEWLGEKIKDHFGVE